jgi:hypothetical protein
VIRHALAARQLRYIKCIPFHYFFCDFVLLLTNDFVSVKSTIYVKSQKPINIAVITERTLNSNLS